MSREIDAKIAVALGEQGREIARALGPNGGIAMTEGWQDTLGVTDGTGGEPMMFTNPTPLGTTTSLPLTLTLPVPPSTNQLYCTVFGRRVLSAEGRKYKAYVGARTPAYRGVMEDNEWLVFTLTFHVPLYNATTAKHKKKIWDLSNRIKVLEDAICAALGIDDRAVIRMELEKVDAPKRDSRVVVVVERVRE